MLMLAALLAPGDGARQIAYRGAGYAWDYPAYGLARRIFLPRPDGKGRVPSLPWPGAAGFLAAALGAPR